MSNKAPTYARHCWKNCPCSHIFIKTKPFTNVLCTTIPEHAFSFLFSCRLHSQQQLVYSEGVGEMVLAKCRSWNRWSWNDLHRFFFHLICSYLWNQTDNQAFCLLKQYAIQNPQKRNILLLPASYHGSRLTGCAPSKPYRVKSKATVQVTLPCLSSQVSSWNHNTNKLHRLMLHSVSHLCKRQGETM